MPEARKEFHYRPAAGRDAGGVDRLINLLDAVHAEARPDLYYVAGEHPRGEAFLESILGDSDQQIFVAEGDGAIVGFVHAIIKRTPPSPTVHERIYAEIDAVVVDPAFRGAGIGRRLIEAAMRWARDRNVVDHQINVHAFNESAKRLYLEMGFEPSTMVLRRVDAR